MNWCRLFFNFFPIEYRSFPEGAKILGILSLEDTFLVTVFLFTSFVSFCCKKYISIPNYKEDFNLVMQFWIRRERQYAL